ncbi:MAG TPA: beta-propeller fold lactonase family protein, partial [Hyphomicrobiaceae bacterium]|nr:beta-propeller fold lactonase family protein [Hyphomicrobiaceae bacterium]
MTKSVASIVYVSCSKGNCIDVLSLDRATGELAHIGFAELSGNGMPLAIGPDQRFLYASVFGDPDGAKQPRYETFAIDSVTGILRHTATLPAVARMSYITVDRGGTFLLGASVAGSVISSHAIDNNGVLQSEPIDVRQVPSKAHHISTDLTNRFAFVPNLGGDIVQQLQFDAANGTFADNSPSRAVLPDGAAPRHMAHHPDGRIVYLLNECAGTLVVYQLDGEAGTLSAIQTSDILPSGFEGTPWGAQIHVSADDRFLFTSERTSSV